MKTQLNQTIFRMCKPGLPSLISLALAMSLVTSLYAGAAPTVVSSAGLPATSIGIRFNETLDPSSSANVANYSLADGTQIDSAQLLSDGMTVVLEVSQLTNSAYTLTINGVQDTNGNATANLVVNGIVLNYTIQDVQGTPYIDAPSLVYSYATNVVDVQVNGGLMWFGSDSLNFVFNSLTNDFDIRVQCPSISGGDGNSIIGIDARDSTDPASPHVFTSIYSGGRTEWTASSRGIYGGNTAVFPGNWAISYDTSDIPNVWLRLRRIGNTMTAFGGTNGTDWTQVGDIISSDFPTNMVVGLCSCSTDAGQPTLFGDFANFSPNPGYTNAGIGLTSQPQNVTVDQSRPATFTVNAVITNGAQGDLIYTWYSNGVAVAEQLTPSFTMAATSLSANGSVWNVAVSAPGVTPATSQSATLIVFADTTPPTVVSLAGLPETSIGIRFDKALDTNSAATASNYTLSDGTPIDSAQLLPDQLTVVLETSQLSASSFTLTINGVMDLAGNTMHNVVANGKTLNYTVQDIVGTPAISTPSLVYSYATNIVDVQVNGGLMWFGSDSFNFVYNSLTNDFDVRVQCPSISGGDGNSIIGIDARNSTDPASPHVFATIYSGGRTEWTASSRGTYGGNTAVFPGNWAISYDTSDIPNVWLRLRRVGNTMTAFGSTNGTDWTQVGDIISSDFPTNMVVGLCSCSTDAGEPTLFGDFANFSPDPGYTNASIGLTSQPQSVTVEQDRPVTFTVNAILTNGAQGDLIYTWYSNGVAVAEQLTPSFTMSTTPLSANGSMWNVAVSAPGLAPVASHNATLTVQADTTPPMVVSISAFTGNSIAIRFNEMLNSDTATNLSNYSLPDGTPILGAQLLADQETVVLSVPQLTNTSSFSLMINGVQDLAGNSDVNLSAPGPVSSFTVLDVNGSPYLQTPSVDFAFATNGFGADVVGGEDWFQSDSFNYIYQTVTGDFDIRTQCSSLSGGDENSNAALDARDTTDPASRHFAVCIYGNTQNRWAAYERATAGANSAVFPGNWAIAYPPGYNVPNTWLRLRRVGNTITAFGGTDGSAWVQAGSSITDSTLPSSMVVGVNTVTTDVNTPALDAVYSNYGSTPLSTNAPTLQASVSNGSMTIEWPTNAEGFQLQTATQLSGEANWSPSTVAPIQVGAMEQVQVPVNSTASFFELTR
ncbi:MAG TPA: Ig-like domain-containing protein [Verrucomicrobiae bacterium]|jgi:hypothetical protein|nr:Ig-like domain-containing protein [Verrucomicrobiae bacterium]